MTTTPVSNGQNLPGLVASNGNTIDVLSGGTATAAAILSGGSAIVEVGGVDSGSTIAAGGVELVFGSANADIVVGSQTVSTGTASGIVTNETVVNGGVVTLAVKTTSAADTTIETGGTLNINGAISAFDTTLSGGTVDLESAKATLTGSLVFSGGGALLVTGNTSAGNGDLAVISGFAGGDVIDMTSATTIGAATSQTLSTTLSSGNTVATVSGGGATDSYIFAGTAIGATLTLTSDGSGGIELIVSGTASAVTSVGSGSSVSNVAVNSGSPLTVYNGGTIVNATILSGGTATILAGGTDLGATISAGGSETLLGSARGDSIYGSQTVSSGGVATGETVQNGGTLTAIASGTVSGAVVESGASLVLSGGALADNTTIDGGTVELQGATDTLAGGFVFNGPGTLDIGAVSSNGYGDQAVISGFYAGDVVNIAPFGSGATLTTTSSGGNTIATVSSGGATETLTFSGAVASSLTLETVGGVAQVDYAGPATTTSYTPGDLVLSIYGDGSGTGSYGLDQAAPITLEEITQSGSVVSVQELPQTTTVTASGITEYAISGEYQSASEGLLTLSDNGQSLVILGYGVTATAFDAANAGTIYGTTALGQTNSILGGQYTAVERIVADISYNGSVDTSTSLSDIFNTNNPRSVYTINGTTFYLSGQGNGTDGTEGVFLANDGASNATAIYNTKTDTREVAIANGTLYVSVDSKSNAGGGVYSFGTTLPTGETTPTQLPGIGASITLTAAEANSVNASAVGTSVHLSPEQYFFASPTVLYIADGGDPKEGGLGDGGLQKWVLTAGTWDLAYTLSEGINQVADTATTGTTGLVGLAGTIEGGNVVFYATNETVAETDQTYLYTITDPLAATTAPTGESFTLLDTAAPDTLIRGVAFAPTSSSTTPVVSTALTVSSGVTSAGLSVTTGGTIIVLNGGTITGTSLLSGGSAVISSGGVDSGTFVAHGAKETVLGNASYDIVDGVQLVSNATAVVSNEVVENGGSLELFLAGATANATTVNTGGGIYVSGHATAENTVIDGGSVVLESPKATLGGTLTFSGTGGVLEESVVISATYGDLATISGFGATDIIDDRVMAGGTLSTSISGADVIATLTSGAVSQSFTLAGSGGVAAATYISGLSATSDTLGGTEIIYTPPPPVDLIVAANATSGPLTITSGNEITVLSGGVMSAITIDAGASAVISNGGTDIATTILAGGTETVSGAASGDQIYGLQFVTTGPSGGTLPATVANETVFNGGTLELYLKPDIATGITVSSGGLLLLSGNVSAGGVTLDGGAFMALQSPKAVISGGVVFSGAATIDITAVTSSGFGGSASLISGWSAGDVIDETLTNPASATLSLTTSGGNTVATITGATYPDVFVFAGTAVSANITLDPDGNGGVELAYTVPCFATGTRIMTEWGDCAVEHLRVGDRALTASGALRPVVWIGQRSLDLRRHPRPHEVMPVRVREDAVAPGCPARDLVLSPEHALFIDGVLVPVRHLVNGATIVQENAERITWWHVELQTHDVILAERLPTESYLDTGNRHAFANGGTTVQMHPDFSRSAATAWARQACAPLVEEGPALAQVRAKLDAWARRLLGTLPAIPEVMLDAVGCATATVPAEATAIRLLSPAGRAGTDIRRLGALIRALRIDGAPVAIDDKRLGLGFHEVEHHGPQAVRWTDGAATLTLGRGDRERRVEVEVVTVIARSAEAA